MFASSPPSAPFIILGGTQLLQTKHLFAPGAAPQKFARGAAPLGPFKRAAPQLLPKNRGHARKFRGQKNRGIISPQKIRQNPKKYATKKYASFP